MNYIRLNLTKMVRQVQSFMPTNFIIAGAFGLLLTSVSCRSGSDTSTPQPTTSAKGDFFGKCTVNGYSCNGDGSTNFTLLYPKSNGSNAYQFAFGMIVNNNVYQQLSVVISLDSFSGKGTYALTSSNTDVNYVVRPAVDSYQSSVARGTLEITDYQYKKYIQGKFNISSSAGTRGLDLKDGIFKVEADF